MGRPGAAATVTGVDRNGRTRSVPVTGARIRSAWHLRSTYFLVQQGGEAMLYPPVPAR
jgi:hypothetical protein